MVNFGCQDCGIDTKRIKEYYMVRPSVWYQATGLDSHILLCVGCLERRLKRELRPEDFSLAPVNTVCERSPRLQYRSGYKTVTDQLQSWFKDMNPRNACFEDRLAKVYIRHSYRILDQRRECFDLASVVIHRPGKWFFSQWLLPWLLRNIPSEGFYVENIHNINFRDFFLRHGFKLVPGDISSVYLLLENKDECLRLLEASKPRAVRRPA